MTISVDAAPGGLFTARGFLGQMRRNHPVRAAALLTGNGYALAPAPLDDYPDSAVAWVAGMYALVFRRPADRDAIDTHTRFLRAGGDPARLLESLVTSPEAKAAGLGNETDLAEAFVVGAFLVILGRLPDASGLATHVAKLHEGVTPDGVLHLLWASEEARSTCRVPPRPVDGRDVLAHKIQTVALRIGLDPDTTAWVKDALERGTTSSRVIRSLARRQYGISPRAALVALTARPRAAAAGLATTMTVRRKEMERDRVWQLQLHRATARRLDHLEHLLTVAETAPRDRADGDAHP